MDNGDMLRSMSNEQLAEFLVNERYRIIKPMFDFMGTGIEKQVVYAVILNWINQPCELEDDNGR